MTSACSRLRRRAPSGQAVCTTVASARRCPRWPGSWPSATATDDLSQPVQLPTELQQHASTGAWSRSARTSTRRTRRLAARPADRRTAVLFRLPRRRRQRRAGSRRAGSTCYPGLGRGPAAIDASLIPALGPSGFATTGVSRRVRRRGDGTRVLTGASCQRNAGHDDRPPTSSFDVDPPVHPTCGTLPDGTPKDLRSRRYLYARLVLHHRVRRLDDGAVPGARQGVLPARVRAGHPLALQRGDRAVGGHHHPARAWRISPICGWCRRCLSPFVVNATPELAAPARSLTVEAASASGAAL